MSPSLSRLFMINLREPTHFKGISGILGKVYVKLRPPTDRLGLQLTQTDAETGALFHMTPTVSS